MKEDSEIKDILQYIGLSLAYKNCENDIKLFKEMQLKSGEFLTWLTEAVMEVLANDQKKLRSIKINVVTKEDDGVVYEWRKGKNQGKIHLNKEQLYKLTARVCQRYFSDIRVKVKGRSWY